MNYISFEAFCYSRDICLVSGQKRICGNFQVSILIQFRLQVQNQFHKFNFSLRDADLRDFHLQFLEKAPPNAIILSKDFDMVFYVTNVYR